MISLQRHIPVVGRILVILLLAANSGFAMVLYTCSMGTMDCCAGMMSGASQSRESGVSLVVPTTACCAITVAGGVNSNPSVTAQGPESNKQKLPCVADLSVASSGIQNCLHLSEAGNIPASRIAASSSVETYVLNATFLI